MASAEAASADVTGVVVLSEQAAANVQAPATRNNPKIFFMVSPRFIANRLIRKPSWYETRGEKSTLRPLTCLLGAAPSPTWFPGEPLLQSSAQFGECLAHSFLYGFDRDLERDSYLRVLETLLATELKNLATFFRQSVDSFAKRLLELGAEHLVLGRWRARGFYRRDCRLAGDDSLMTDVIERAIAGRSKQIRAKRLLDLQGLPPPPQLQHHFLSDLLGERAFADDRFSHPHQVCVVGAEYRIEGALVSGTDAFLERPLARIVRIQVGWRSGAVSVLLNEYVES